MSSGGHIRQRSPGSWEIRYSLSPGSDGNRRIETKTIRGSKGDAKRALRAALGAVDRGEHVEPTKVTVAEHVRTRIEQWQASGKVGARTAEHYGVCW